ncbi:deoxynucleoside monophosphate kinase [Vibrio phage D479]
MHIAICGYRGSGKDYAGQIISDAFGHRMVAFADPIREEICETYQLTGTAEYDVFKRSIHEIRGREIDGRDIVRNTGMFARRANVNFFVEEVKRKMIQPVVITDLRFENEYKFCKEEEDVIVIQVLSDKTESDGHESETIPFEPDFKVKNSHDWHFRRELINLVNGIYDGDIDEYIKANIND